MDDKYFSSKKKEFCNYMETSGLFGTLDHARFILVLDGYCVETFLTWFFPVSSIFEAERKEGSSPSFIPSWIRIRCYRHVPNWKVEWTASRLETLRSLKLLRRGDGVHVVHCKASPTIRRNSLCLSRTILRWISLHKNLALFLHSRVFFFSSQWFSVLILLVVPSQWCMLK